MRTARLTAAAALAIASAQVLAHEGHGALGASHWHASDTIGLLLVGALAALAVWFSRGGK